MHEGDDRMPEPHLAPPLLTAVPSLSINRSASSPSPRSRMDVVRRIVADGGPSMFVQPQFSLSRLEVAGYEALARFAPYAEGLPGDPEPWFRSAHDAGLGAELEAAAVAAALRLPSRPPGTTLAVNLSPSVLGSPALTAVLPDDLSGVEIELTEHEAVSDTDRVGRELDALRERGARLAIDDVGAAYSGLRRIMELAPDTLKLDRHLVTGVAGNSARAALISAVVDFADHIGATVCAEGVESIQDLLTLADLDVAFAQGSITGSPAAEFLATDSSVVLACRDSLARVLVRSSPRPQFEMPGSLAPLEDLLTRLADVRTLNGLASLVASCSTVLGCDRAVLSYLRDGGTAVQAIVPDTHAGEGAVFPLDAYPLTRRCLERGEIVPVYDQPHSDPAEVALLERLGMQSTLLVPVTSQGEPIGLLEAYLADDAPWSRRQVRFARLLASVLGPVLALLR
jgi:EAL domain-containing protein (putative c-di-GMP-specific phosphodiesterase class I)